PFCNLQQVDANRVYNNCGKPATAIFYCVSFMILSSFLLINLVVAVVLTQFEQDNDKTSANTLTIVSVADLKTFLALWSKFSPSHSMTVKDLKRLLNDLPEGHCMRKPPDITMTRYITLLMIP